MGPANELLICLDGSTDPVRNLLIEDDLFGMVDAGRLPQVVRLWTNEECLVRGRARSARYGWYDEGLASSIGMRVVERSTGGGVVYHDAGNLNWSFFLKTDGTYVSPRKAFETTSGHVVGALRLLGVPAYFSPPNRIDISGRKVSGMAARSTARTLLVHGTLLLRSNLERLNALCIPPAGCPPVANVAEWAEDIGSEPILRALASAVRSSGFNAKVVDRLPLGPPAEKRLGSEEGAKGPVPASDGVSLFG